MDDIERSKSLTMRGYYPIPCAAKGRVWTGGDAQALGLLDELGGFPTALRIAR
ncbi:MAG: hypothetical protein WA970_02030 [Gammaproteobacteria bacterium]